MVQQSSDRITQNASENHVSPAWKSGVHEFEITVGEVHRALRMKNRVPQVSAALRSNRFLNQNNPILVGESGPPSGMSTTTRLKYRFLKRAEPGTSSGAPSDLTESRESSIYQKTRDLYGIARELYSRLGGGERLLREERERFYGESGGPGSETQST